MFTFNKRLLYFSHVRNCVDNITNLPYYYLCLYYIKLRFSCGAGWGRSSSHGSLSARDIRSIHLPQITFKAKIR